MKYDFNELAILVQKAKDGDSASFITLYEQTYQGTYLLAYSILKNKESAEDAVQEVYANVYLNLHKLNCNKTFIAWLNKITYNTSSTMYVRNKHVYSDGIDLSYIQDTNKERDPVEVSATKIQNEALCSLIDDLDTTLKVTLILKYYKNFKIREIAQIMGCPEGTVKSRLTTSKKILKNQIVNSKSHSVFLSSFTVLPLKHAVDLYAKQSYIDPSFSYDFIAASATLGAVSVTSSTIGVAGVTTVSSLQTLFASIFSTSATLATGISLGSAAVATLALTPALSQYPVLTNASIYTNVVGFTNEAVTVSVGIDGTKSLISTLYVTAEDGEIWGPTSVSEKTAMFKLTENGSYIFSMKNKENIVSTSEITIDCIDTSSPVLTTYSIDSNVLTIITSDDLSGVNPLNTYGEDVNGNRVIPFEILGNTFKFHIDESQSDFKLYLEDVSGNRSKYNVKVSVIKK